MSGINTNSLLIRDAVNLCTGVIEILIASQKNMQYKYQSAGKDWSDSKYQQLGDIVNECSLSIRKTLHELNGCRILLGNLGKAIEEYESVNIGGMDNSVPSNSGGISNISRSGATPLAMQMSIPGMYGGSYRDCKKYSAGKSGSEEAHHLISNSVCRINGIDKYDAPAIIMSVEDHSKTASYDSKRGSKAYREIQNQLVRQGRIEDALRMDIENNRSLFGDKYENGINAALSSFERLYSRR